MKFSILKQMILTLLTAVVFIACSSDEEQVNTDENTTISPNASLTQGEKLSFDLKMLDESSIAIRAENGKIDFTNSDKATLFVFFATWCAPCIAEIPHLNKMQERYKDKVDVVGVLLEDKNNDEINEFVAKNKINYRVANGEANYLLAKAFGGVGGIPAMFLYSKNGKLFNQYLGVIPGEMLEIELLKAIS